MYGISLGLGRARALRQKPATVYDFRSSTLPAAAIFTRSSVATDVINGVLTDFLSGAARVSTLNGYLSETSRTNSLRNGNASGSTAGIISSGGALPTNWSDVNTVGLTRTIVGSGLVNGFPYIDLRLSGTPSAGTYDLLMEATNQIAAAPGQRWTGSFWIGILSGSLTGITSVNARVSGRASGSEVEGTSQSIVPTIDPVRVSAIRLLNNGSTTHIVTGLSCAVTAVPIDATFRIAACQLELGHGATSYIRTSTGAVTRSADVLYIPTTDMAGYNSKGALIFNGKAAKFISPVESQYFGCLTNHPSLSDEHRFFKDPWNFNYLHYQGLVSYGGSAFAETNKGPELVVGTAFSVGASWDTGSGNVKVNNNGGTPSSLTLSSLPNNCSRLYVGCSSAGLAQHCGYIEQVTYYPTARSDI